MLGLRRKNSARGGVRAALVAGATVAAFGVAGLNAGAAAAEPVCTGSNITGQGSSLQRIAQQEVWGPAFASSICNKGTLPTITYNSTGSGAGMKEWNHDGKKGSINTALSFIGTDDAPTAAQISNIKSVASGAQVAVIPVAQTSIAIVAHPPVGCEVEAITNGDFVAVMEGRFLTWSKLSTAEGEGCSGAITRVVRKDGSGTSFQSKNYLFNLNKKGLACTTGGTEGKASWQELEPITNGETGAPNTSWPETCVEKTLSPVVRPAANGGGEEVKKVNTTEGGIGYAALPDAMGNKTAGTVLLALQNNGQKPAFEASFGEPATGSVANCAAVAYKTPANVNTGLDLDWSAVFGAQPNIGGFAYPLCTLTYVLAFHGYGAAGFTAGQERTVRDYLTEYLTQTAGQSAINSHFYSALPSNPGETRIDILGAAQKAAARISF
jgi:ABC-type phosphate transport system substrate-binding protein